MEQPDIQKQKMSLIKLFEINGEFDPGSGQTLAACLTHASRTDEADRTFRSEDGQVSGGWVSNAWGTYPQAGNNREKLRLIPHKVKGSHEPFKKDGVSCHLRMDPRLIS